MLKIKSIKKRISSLSNNKDGFTLIEIIAVLVILGILAAVAIPRFTSLQADARNSAAQTAIAEVKARASLIYGSQLLTNLGNTLNVDGTTVGLELATNTEYGDFTVALTPTVASIGIEVLTVQTVATTDNNTSTWFTPGL